MKIKAYPKPLVRVTGGLGGEAVLIKGILKTALHDCGMACFAKETIANLEAELGAKPLDYIILSHSHYDHMGALPYLLKRWPEAKVCASQKTKEVFGRKGAVETIISMGKTAAEFYGKNPEEIEADGLRVDIVMENGDVLDLGDEKLMAIETKGHTDCSMSYFIQPQAIILASESTGVLESEDKLHTSILKSFRESLESATFLKLLPYKEVLIPHYGMLPEKLLGTYFDMYIEAATEEKELIEALIDKGYDLEEIFSEHKKIYWNKVREANHPYRAYKLNTTIIIKRMIEEKTNPAT